MRNKIFDIIRGFAIALMVLANPAPLFHGQFPFILRILFSLPAPTFIFISGLMLAFVHQKHPFYYFLKRGMFIISVAMLTDAFINKEIPFQGFDVLYLIGFSMPVIAIALRFKNEVLYAFVAVTFILAEASRWYFGYVPDLHLGFFSWLTFEHYLIHPEIKNWVYNGWFPFLPWSGLMLFGALIGKLFIASKDENFFRSKQFLIHIAGMVGLGIILYLLLPSANMYARDGYNEIFYPAQSGLLILLTLCPMLFLALSKFIQTNQIANHTFGELGRSSLALYVFHLFLIQWVWRYLFAPVTSLYVYLALYALHISMVYIAADLLLRFKTKHQNLPTLVNWMLGK